MTKYRLFLNTRSGSVFFRSLNQDESDLFWDADAESEDAARAWALSKPGITEVVRVEVLDVACCETR